jgi:dTDP-4-dehydrorhamnose 3,5-epimerase
MEFVPLLLSGAYLVELKPVHDERGFFARTWCTDEFKKRGLSTKLAQCAISYNGRRGTLRGMHYQAEPYAEAKLVRCSAGAIYDVIVDLRQGSATYRQWLAVELTAANHKMIYIPEGFAHGFQTLADDSEVFYQISEPYVSECARGVRWDDPVFRIKWPIADPIISDRDRNFPDHQS